MADLRTQLALVLGVGLGVVLIAYPALIVRVHTVGRVPQDRGGQYGEDDLVPPVWRNIVRAIGVVLIAVSVALWL